MNKQDYIFSRIIDFDSTEMAKIIRILKTNENEGMIRRLLGELNRLEALMAGYEFDIMELSNRALVSEWAADYLQDRLNIYKNVIKALQND